MASRTDVTKKARPAKVAKKAVQTENRRVTHPRGAAPNPTGILELRAASTARALYRANPMERIEMMRKGLPAQIVASTAGLLHIPQERLNQKLNIPRATVDRKVRENKPLSQEHSERVIGIISLVGQVEEIMADAGDESVEFDAGAWVAAWLEEPLPALGNRTAGELMDTAEGQQLVSRLLAQSVSGAYV